MKLLFSISIFLITCTLYSQWEADARITNDNGHSYTCFNGAWGVAVSSNFVHLVWFDDRHGATNREIYYRRSTNSGTSFETEIRITNSALHSFHPCIAASGSVVHIIWQDSRDGNDEIYYKRSSDNGATWGTDTRLTNAANWSQYPSLSVNLSNVHVVWDDAREGNDGIYYKRSTDGGLTWSPDVRLTNNTSYSWYPSVWSTATRIHVVWVDDRDMNWEIYYKQSTDGGTTWGADTRLTNNSSSQTEPCVTASGNLTHVVWKDSRDGNLEVYYKRSTDDGATWETDTRLSTTAGQTWYPSIQAAGQNIHLVFNDYTVGAEIFYNRSTDGGVTWGTNLQLTAHTTGGSFRPSIAVLDPALHVVFVDTRNGSIEEIYYKRNPTGIIGITPTSYEVPNGFSIGQNYPNPFNPVTKIKFALPTSSFAKLVIYDVLGREVEILVNEQLQPGTYEVDFPAPSEDGSRYSSGVYFYKLTADNFSQTKKMILMK